MTDYVEIWAAAWPVITALIAVCSALDATIPQPRPGSHWLIPRKIVSFIAINVAQASNGGQPSFVTWIVRIAQPVLDAQAKANAAPEAAPSPATPAPGGVIGMLAVLVLGFGLSACALFGQIPWTPAQTAYVELSIGTAAENVAANVITAPGLSDLDRADIKAGAKVMASAVQAQIAILTNGGTVDQQAISAAVSAVASAVSDLGTVLNAKHGATADPNVIALTAGEAALQNLPGVISAVVQVNGGWLPVQADLDKALTALQTATAKVGAVP